MIEEAVYSGYSLDTVVTPTSAVFSANGLSLYVANNNIYKWTLQSPFMIENATSNGHVFTPPPSGIVINGMQFGDDGNYLYVCDQNPANIYRYTLSTPYDISTADTGTEQSCATIGSDLYGFAISPEGLHLYSIDNGTDAFQQYDLTVAWDLTSKTTLSSFSTTVYPSGVSISPDGAALFTIDNINDKVIEISLPTALDLSSAVDNNLSKATGYNTTKGLAFSPDHYHYIVIDTASYKAYQFDIPLGSPKASFTVTSSMSATASVKPPTARASFTVTSSMSAKGGIKTFPYLFRFVQEIQGNQIQKRFRFVQEIEQAKTSTMIIRTNI